MRGCARPAEDSCSCRAVPCRPIGRASSHRTGRRIGARPELSKSRLAQATDGFYVGSGGVRTLAMIQSTASCGRRGLNQSSVQPTACCYELRAKTTSEHGAIKPFDLNPSGNWAWTWGRAYAGSVSFLRLSAGLYEGLLDPGCDMTSGSMRRGEPSCRP